jgi:hypothetical protein
MTDGRKKNNHTYVLGKLHEANIEVHNLAENSAWTQTVAMLAPDFFHTYKTQVQKAAYNWRNSYLQCKNDYKSINNYTGIADTNYVPYSLMKEEIARTLGVDAGALWGNEYESDPGYRQLLLNFVKNRQHPPVTLESFLKDHRENMKEITAYQKHLDTLAKLCALPANERRERLAKLFGGLEEEDFKAYLDYEEVSQDFLLKALKLLYDAGEYVFIADFILDKLDERIERDDDLKAIAAHIYGSTPVGEYAKAVALLASISEASFSHYADNKTAMVSNIVRNAFVLSEIDEESIPTLLCQALNAYEEICQHHPHYYPAVNYAYTYAMLEAIRNDACALEDFDEPRTLFEDYDVQASMNEATYYARVSRWEFLMLLNEPIDTNVPKEDLAQTTPTSDMLQRTLRQLAFFKDTLETYGTAYPPQGFHALYSTLNDILESFSKRSNA